MEFLHRKIKAVKYFSFFLTKQYFLKQFWGKSIFIQHLYAPNYSLGKSLYV